MKRLKYSIICSFIICLLSGCNSAEGSVMATTPDIESVSRVLETVESTKESNVVDEEMSIKYTEIDAKEYLNKCLETDTAVFKYYDNVNDKEYVYYLTEDDIKQLNDLLINSDIDTTKNSLNADFTYTIHMFDKEGNYVYVVSVDKDKITTYYEPGMINNEELTKFIVNFKDKSNIIGLSDGLDIHNLVESFENDKVGELFSSVFSKLLFGQYRIADNTLDLDPIEVNMIKSVISDLRVEPYNETSQKEYLDEIQKSTKCVVIADENSESANVGNMLWVYSLDDSDYYYLELDNLSFEDKTVKRYVFRFTDSKERVKNAFSKFEK